ncbi:unnamed protein product, partial [Adineta ricciae]
ENDVRFYLNEIIMISANASWIFHSNPKLATYHWTSAGCEITNEDGSFSFKNPHQNFVQFSIDKQAHPKRHVIYALISMILFFPTGKIPGYHRAIEMQTGKVIDHIVKWLKDYTVKNAGAKGFTVGISNGIDSSVVSTLCARTGLPLLAVELPIHHSKPKEKGQSVHIDWLKQKFGNEQVRSLNVNLTDSYKKVKETFTNLQENEITELALANVQSRLRMLSLYYFAQVNGYLVAGTGNKVEDFGIGFFTKYGDGGVDISPIGDLLKSEVRLIARDLGIDRSIIEAAPTDGLFGDMRTDEAQIGATYDELEWAMAHANKDKQSMNERQREVTKIYLQRHRANLHKMKEIPVCRIPKEFKQDES